MRTALAAIALTFSVVSLTGCEKDAASPDTSVIRHQADTARDRIWSLTRDGVALQVRAKPGRTAIELPGWVWAHAPWACPPDLAIGPKGEAVITSNVAAVLWRIDPETLAVTVHPIALGSDTHRDFGFSKLAYSREKGVFIAVSDTFASTWEIDAQLATARKLAGSGPVSSPCRFSDQ
jgi:hypothetical protein